MSKAFWNVWLVALAPLGVFLASPVFLGTSLLTTPSAIAGEVDATTEATDFDGRNAQPAGYVALKDRANKEAMAQVTSVSELSDVQPTDWAFQAVQSLVERYGCIEGYPNKTFQGNQTATRYELAAALNACLNQLSAQLGGLTTEDLTTLQRLQEEFAAELAAVRGRVDALEARTQELEANQFSTTTKLTGEAIFNAVGLTGDVADGTDEAIDANIALGYRARLNFDTSFSGDDLLRVRLQARSVPDFSEVSGTDMARLGFDGLSEGEVGLNTLFYLFPLGKKSNVYVAANAFEYFTAVDTFSPLQSAAQGSISRFGRFNPLYRVAGSGGTATGAVANIGLGSKAATLSLGYLVPSNIASSIVDEETGELLGLFGSQYSASAQLSLEPTENIGFGLLYVRSFFPNGSGLAGGTGSAFAENPFDGAPTTANSYGAQGNILLGSLNLSGWVGYTQAFADNGTDDNADLLNYAVSLSFLDLGKEGNAGAIVFGQPPKVLHNDVAAREDPGTSYHLEGLYRFQLTDNISITPGAFVVFNPESNSDNDPIYVGTIRTTFTF